MLVLFLLGKTEVLLKARCSSATLATIAVAGVSLSNLAKESHPSTFPAIAERKNSRLVGNDYLYCLSKSQGRLLNQFPRGVSRAPNPTDSVFPRKRLLLIAADGCCFPDNRITHGSSLFFSRQRLSFGIGCDFESIHGDRVAYMQMPHMQPDRCDHPVLNSNLHKACS